MMTTPLQAMLGLLDCVGSQRTITVAHAENLPRGDRERKLRNDGLALCTPPLTLWRGEWPGIIFETQESADLRASAIITTSGRIVSTTRTGVDRSLACDLPYDASAMRRELEVEPWIEAVEDIAPAIDWIAAEVHLPDHEVYEHARFDYGADALIVVRGPVSATGAAFALCGSRVEIWQELWREAAGGMSALLAALAQREHRKLAVLAGCPADLVLLGGDTALPRGIDLDLVRHHDLPLLQAAARQCAQGGLRFGLETMAVPEALLNDLASAATPTVLVTSWPLASALPADLPLWVRLPPESLAPGTALVPEAVADLLGAAASRRLVVDLGDAGLSRCTSPAQRERGVASAAAVLEMVGGFCM